MNWENMKPVTQQMTPEQVKNALRDKWFRAKKQLDEVKALEMELRKQVFELDFPNPTLGTQRIELADGFKLKAVYSINYKLLGGNDTIESVQDSIARLNVTGSVLADRLVKWKPELSESEYKKLDPAIPEQAAIKAVLDKIIETKPSSPTLEIEAPKAKA